eukprot:IDg17332t1
MARVQRCGGRRHKMPQNNHLGGNGGGSRSAGALDLAKRIVMRQCYLPSAIVKALGLLSQWLLAMRALKATELCAEWGMFYGSLEAVAPHALFTQLSLMTSSSTGFQRQ